MDTWLWYDYWRGLNVMLALASLLILFYRYLWRPIDFSPLTSGLWFACLVWSATGFVSSLEGIFLHAQLGVRVPMVTIGAIATIVVGARREIWLRA